MAQTAIAGFLRERLRLELRGDAADPVRVARGVDFVGWKTWWDRRLPRRRALGNLHVRLDAFARCAVRPAFSGRAHAIDLECADVARLQSVVASYSGDLRHGWALRAWEGAWARHPWLTALFACRGWAFESRWPPRRLARARRFREQYWELVRRAGGRCLVFCQVGRFVEFRGPQRALAERALELRRTYLPRAGFAFAAGFPVGLAGQFAARAVSRGLMVADVRERSDPGRAGCTPRLPVTVLVPAALSPGAREGS